MVAWTGLTEVNKKRLVHFLLTLKGCIFYLILQLPKSKWWMNISLKDNQTHQTLIHNEKKKISSMKWIHTITLNNTQNITTKYTNKQNSQQLSFMFVWLYTIDILQLVITVVQHRISVKASAHFEDKHFLLSS